MNYFEPEERTEKKERNPKNKGSFYRGILTGIVITVLCAGIGIGAYWAYRFFYHGDMSVEAKANVMLGYLEKYYIEDVNYDAVAEGIFDGIARSQGDPYTTYMNTAEVQSFLESNNGSFYGIGVEVSVNEDRNLVVVTTLPDTPAEHAGLLPEDILTEVDGKSVLGMDLDLAVSHIRGEKGTDVAIKVYRPSENRYVDMTITRAQINTVSVSYEMLEDNIGYIRLTQFKKNTTEQFQEALNVLTAGGMKGLVLDVRSNPGGLFDTVVAICDILLPEGLVVYTVDYDGTRVDTFSAGDGLSVPFVLLVNGSSASASEILAGAVQDRGAAPIIGTQTFGKGVVQQMYWLPDGSAMKITMQKYYTPNGTSIHGTGVTPDYVVELAEDKDTQMEKAVEVLKQKMAH